MHDVSGRATVRNGDMRRCVLRVRMPARIQSLRRRVRRYQQRECMRPSMPCVFAAAEQWVGVLRRGHLLHDV